VDDEQANLDVLTAHLGREGYANLTTLSDPREVAPACRASQPDLILLDLHMPYLDGFEVLEQLRAIIPPDCYVPILVLTADDSREVRHRALQAGAHDFLTKPFDRTEVLLRVRNLLQTRALHRSQEDRAHRDQVTQLPNRAHFLEALAAALISSTADEARLALLLVSLGGIGEAKTAFGPAAADQLLQEAAGRLVALCRPADTLARTGDAQFALLMPEARMASAEWAARKILSALARPVILGSEPVPLRAAVGIALSPEHGVAPDTLEHVAALALATAATSPAGYCLYAEARELEVTRQRTLVATLGDAVHLNQLILHYQPKLALGLGNATVTGAAITGMEALVRWHHPQQGLILPLEFIGLAEQHGLIDEVTQWVIAEALRQCHDWQRERWMLDIAVNVSMRSLVNRDLPHVVAGLLQRFGVPPKMLVLEITESALGTDPERIRAVLKQLAALGVRLSLDNFGTGHSSLAYLQQLPVSELKIDRSFVTGMTAVSRDRTLVESMAAMGRKLRLAVVAEGVEQQHTLTLLANLGCTHAQGNYICPPLPADALAAWLDESRWAFRNVSWR
jgi:diguanylate cyclase (GGDEF)-like protein